MGAAAADPRAQGAPRPGVRGTHAASDSADQVLVEAGPGLGSALMAAGLIDEVVLYQAPVVLGGGKSWLEDIGISTIADARTLTLISTEVIGPDVKFRYRVEKR